MKNNISFLYKIIILFICAAFFTAGCVVVPKTPQTNTNENNNQGTPPANNVTIPKSLDNIESAAEDMIDDLAAQDWTKANDKLSTLKTNWATFQTEAINITFSQDQVTAFNDALNNLKKNIQDKKQYEALLSANNVTLNTVGFMELYNPKVPADVGRLDYYGRQVMLTVGNGDLDQANADSQAAEDTWNKIKTQAENINADHAKSFSDTLAGMKDAVSKKDVNNSINYSKTFLDQVDILESDFSK